MRPVLQGVCLGWLNSASEEDIDKLLAFIREVLKDIENTD